MRPSDLLRYSETSGILHRTHGRLVVAGRCLVVEALLAHECRIVAEDRLRLLQQTRRTGDFGYGGPRWYKFIYRLRLDIRSITDHEVTIRAVLARSSSRVLGRVLECTR